MSINPLERLLGKLEANHDSIIQRLDKMEKKIDNLQAFRWKMIGGAMVVSLAVSIAIELMR